MQMDKMPKLAIVSWALNMAYSAYHVIFGVVTRSWWLFTIGVYYAILSVVRLAVLRSKGKESFIVRFTGIMLMILSLPLAGTVVLAFMKDRGGVFGEIAMIAMATYAFTKLTLATVNLIKSQRGTSAKQMTLRNISFADAFVSIFSLQRSMLVSFEGMSAVEIRIMNVALGSAVCVTVFLLGFNLVNHKKVIGRK